MNKNITAQEFKIGKDLRQKANGHSSFLVFFTGLSGSGKSTIANALEQKLYDENIKTYVLDGDNVRKGINKNLSFSEEDRSENIRRIGEISKLFVDAGLVVLAAFIAPYEKDRKFIERIIGKKNYVEVYVGTSLEECERRDVKGLYKKARKGEIKNMTGISAPYEKPKAPTVKIDQDQSVQEAVNLIFAEIKNKLSLK
ncbi:adenylyl-sulfate kinase [Pricia sp. S334]|uniref:Adenylyl-sulfate kinase n=1 Tax=Pricia mediterranea TaxID=3076079 RepID=A0ABU3L8Y8_9FLAO|nr:adenylyl-sulfate kinase [Pricia sp. S334]MDT7830210.1 adenylyl-sulfate kinase [Pricia sp. S334]